MRLIQIYLPLRDNEDKAFPKENYSRIRETLTKKFGGLTAYTRAPAEGFWKDDRKPARRDELIIFEVMDGKLKKSWWKKYKRQLKKTFSQDEIIVRVQKVKTL